METRYLIIGNSIGGIGAAEAIRAVDREGGLTIVSDEPYAAYSRPMISKYLSGGCTIPEMLLRPADFYNNNSINIITGKRVVRILCAERVAEMDTGERINWDKLLLACGGVSIRLRLKGMEKPGVFNFTMLDDAGAVRDFLPSVNAAVVVGGGLIGISAAEALSKCGIKVTIIEMKDRILNAMLDEAASGMVAERIGSAGVEIITGSTVREIKGRETVSSVELDGGETIPAGLVIMAAGVSPRVELAEDAGIAVNRGIVVDRAMETSCEGIYACGDAAEAYDFVYGVNRVVPVWPNACIGGRVAGSNMAGRRVEYAGGTSVNSLSYFGIDIVSAGMIESPGGDGYETIIENSNGIYRKVILKDGIMVGIICAGDIDKAGILFGLMRDRIDVAEFKSKLVCDGFGLASLPRGLWQAKLATLPVSQ